EELRGGNKPRRGGGSSAGERRSSPRSRHSAPRTPRHSAGRPAAAWKTAHTISAARGGGGAEPADPAHPVGAGVVGLRSDPSGDGSQDVLSSLTEGRLVTEGG